MEEKNHNHLNIKTPNTNIFKLGWPIDKKKVRLTMNNEILLEREFTKYLSVVIDNKLTWKQHI